MQFGLIELNGTFIFQFINTAILLVFLSIMLVLLIKQFKMYGQISRIKKILSKKFDSLDTTKEL
ncbi:MULTISPECIES: hypothetical protein [unclassified Fusibacter]|uniref:hypothetical protein n=1 Tax=unclassified Fusibacter TaxID=2624464 RepID=UPI001012408F|nr:MULTISPECIES: hypothetical protein [unclassified Fusibacter]MCK8058361.1 hypothetical protein [Fusibacter sp. A2]NPE20944.1 hypothetical protein [Fusibacter sp. A1]RXV63146.1 hypothetical protein DWB64_03840 [Fusibacter sp. A1]